MVRLVALHGFVKGSAHMVASKRQELMMGNHCRMESDEG
jgi:hypothetical protein